MSIPNVIDTIPAGDTVPARASAIDEIILEVTIPEQKLDNWCWAAVAAGLERFYGFPEREQCQIVSSVLQTVCCDAGVSLDLCNLPLSADPALGIHLRRKFTDPKHRTFGFVHAQISRGYPIVVRIDWNEQGAGHLVVINGYRREGKKIHLYVCDPESGKQTKVRFEHFLSYYKEKGFWDISYETKGMRPMSVA